VTGIWGVIAVLFIATVLIKASGPLAVGGRHPPKRVLAVIALVAPALLTALVVYETFVGSPSGVTLDARIAGVAVALAAALAKLPMIVVVILAAAATAGVRLVA
jgi:MFS-type transporter involved in bile tolerance (Atg22 family)